MFPSLICCTSSVLLDVKELAYSCRLFILLCMAVTTKGADCIVLLIFFTGDVPLGV